MNMKKSVYLIRHAKTRQPAPGESDYNRALLPRGYKDTELIARELITNNTVPRIIVSSGAVRAVQTAEVFLSVFHDAGFQVQHQIEKELYLSPVNTLFETAKNYLTNFDEVAIVAHNPGIQAAANTLSTSPQHEAPTCAVFHFRVPQNFKFREKIDPERVLFPRYLK